MNKGTPAAFDKAMEFLQAAVDKDPADPLAYAGLAMGFMNAGHLSDVPDYKAPRARAAAARALQLDDSLADAHLVLGVLDGYRDFNWDACERGIQKALSLNPNLAFAHFHMGWLHCNFERWDAAIASGKRTLELDPLSVVNYWVTDFYRMAGRFEECIANAKRAIENNPKTFTAYFTLGSTYLDMKRHDEAITTFKRGSELAPAMIGYLGLAYANAGRKEEARKILAQYEGMKLSGWTAFWRGTLHAALDEYDAAFRILDFSPHHDWLPSVKFNPEFKPVRKDPRFLALMKRINLPPPA